MLELKNLCKNYANIHAIQNISFSVKPGDVLGFLGPNGAGKSTSMKIICGVIPASSGNVLIDGIDIFESPLEAKQKIGYLPEHPPLYLDMSVQDYLLYVAQLKRVPKQSISKYVNDSMEQTQLSDVRHRIIGHLSKGYRQRIGIAQAIVAKPKILVLDEPTVGLDPKQMHEIRTLIQQLSSNHSLILSTHILSEVQLVCNRVIIINKGKILAEQTMQDWNAQHQNKQGFQLLVKQNEKLLPLLKNLNNIIIKSERKMENNLFEFDLEYTTAMALNHNDILKTLLNQNIEVFEIKNKSSSLEESFLKIIQDSQEQKI